MNPDCTSWEGNQYLRKQAELAKAFAQVDSYDKALSNLAHAIVSDPRRAAAVKTDCAKYWAEIQAIAKPSAAAKAQIDDPLHDDATLSAWLSSLTDDQLETLKVGVEGALSKKKM
jgi:hypothetical protein